MQYVTYIALMFGAASAKEIIIDINEDEIKKSMQIEQQEFGKLMNNPEFQNAAGAIGGDAAQELAKAQAKFITQERGILMPSVKIVTNLLDAMFIMDGMACDKGSFETCLSARPQPINPLATPPQWNYGRLRQCSDKSGCEPKYNIWNRKHQDKFQGRLQKNGMEAEQNFQKLAQAYEKAYFQFAQRNTANFDTIVAKFLEAEYFKAAGQYRCSPDCVKKCFSNLNEYAQCSNEAMEHYPQWQVETCGCKDFVPPVKISGLFNLPSVTDNTRCSIDDAGSFNCGMIY